MEKLLQFHGDNYITQFFQEPMHGSLDVFKNFFNTLLSIYFMKQVKKITTVNNHNVSMITF